MNYSLTDKSKQFFWLLIKLSIVFGCGYFIWLKLTTNNQLSFDLFYQNLIKNDVFSIKNLLFLFALSFLNWFLEILKWKTLASFCIKITKKSAAIQSLASLTTSLITPNRIGEYGAKALYFEKPFRKQILSLNLIGNLYQLLATLFFGVLGLLYFVNKQNVDLNFSKIFNWILIGFAALLVFLFLWKTLLSRKNLFKSYTVKLSSKQHFKVAFLSFLKYLVFSHQFYCLLLIFNVDISYINAFTAISSTYLISSFIPMLSIFDAILKGTVAIFIFSFFKIDALTVLSITTLMWILNFVLPASFGSYFVLTFKTKQTT
ncbi:lysylphosphatidylglycerol synthase domain-containing protein [Polaribacter sp. IC073]|uniref:lysylphosphatidylglycerol synthase domain-containing protein n=1 Tax=Polaribacter sp. IC073 TaxID=2508540 RepID=UPI0011BEEECD|nr:lysylphosphatidylglycerol synthase domain-containing protein [Polaribacter sp. IC073]TXD47973.1 hypothetical protein ES045_09075 [Polaribacter sp. IC073]